VDCEFNILPSLSAVWLLYVYIYVLIRLLLRYRAIQSISFWMLIARGRWVQEVAVVWYRRMRGALMRAVVTDIGSRKRRLICDEVADQVRNGAEKALHHGDYKSQPSEHVDFGGRSIFLSVFARLIPSAHALVPSSFANSGLVMRCRCSDIHHGVFGSTPCFITVAIHYTH
jgi:hypothetical protein